MIPVAAWIALEIQPADQSESFRYDGAKDSTCAT
jgi:hypothetical protein